MVALRLAWRDLRGGMQGVWLVLACLALGVAAIAAVGSLRAGVQAGLASQGQRLLGGDLEVQTGAEPPSQALRAWMEARGAVSEVVTLRSLLVAPDGRRQLVELKAVDPAYPLLGSAALSPPGPLGAALAGGGLVAEPLVLDRLGLAPGARARLGSAEVVVRAALLDEPDRLAASLMLAPRAMIALATLPGTELIQPGSLVEHALRLRLPAGVAAAPVAASLRTTFPGKGYRVRLAGEVAPAIGRFIDQTALFLTLVGLCALLVGGIGVATGVTSWLQARRHSIAVLRCLGAPARTILVMCMLQVGLLCGLGVAGGVVAGAGLGWIAGRLLAGVLPVAPLGGPYPAPLLLAALYGVLVAACFSLPPLARAARTPGAALFRAGVLDVRDGGRGRRGRGWWVLASSSALAACLVLVLVATAGERGLTLWFVAAAAATLLVFRSGAGLLALAARHAPPLPAAWARLGVGALGRPGGSGALLLVALGLGLSTLAAVALIEGNLRAQVASQIPARAPTFFFIDIQAAQLDRFRAVLDAIPGVEEVRAMPSLRARIVSVRGVPADRVQASPETRWALRGDRGLTYAALPPAGTRLVAGHWWPADYAGPPLVSFDAGLARGWGVGVGDEIVVNVLGREIALRVASLREIDWRSLGINFAMVASPGLLERAPHGVIATVRTTPAAEAPVLRALSDALPNVTGIRVADVLGRIGALLGQLAAALAAAAATTLASGMLVLGGAVAAGQRRRLAEAAVLRAVGATAGQIRAAWLTEFALLGLVAGVLAAAIGTAASLGVMRWVMRAEWVFLPGRLAATILGCMALVLVLGHLGTRAALKARVAPLLRGE